MHIGKLELVTPTKSWDMDVNPIEYDFDQTTGLELLAVMDMKTIREREKSRYEFTTKQGSSMRTRTNAFL